ncbi:MAG: GNAT family N-acetyltransferase [Hydrotalea sp.]|nr:GNAT family N-acetyltransferase [Hydrotalea sp.]
MNDIIIRPLSPGDANAWRGLFRGYCEFYKVAFSDDLADRVWQWLMDDGKDFHGLVATQVDKLLGFAHYRSFPSSLTGTTACFFDDLFVLPDTRGKKIGRQLMMAVKDVAKKNGWTMVTWLTADNNYRARPLYDSIATRTSWITYEMDV